MKRIIKFPLIEDQIVELNVNKEKVIKEHIIKETAQSFSEKVEDLVWMKDIPYFEAIQILQDENGYEPEYVAKLLTPLLYSKLSEELEKVALVKKTNRLDL
jgi:hypothetical protein